MHLPSLQRLLLPSLCALTALCSCASEPGTQAGDGVTGDALRITYRDYRAGRQTLLELVSESHTDMVALYSEKVPYSGRSGTVSAKVAPDVVVWAIIDHLEGLGYEDVAVQGRAPRSGDGRVAKAFEIETPQGTTNFAVLQGQYAVESEWQLIYDLFRDFGDAFNAIPAYQAVDNPLGGALFDDPLKVKR